MLYRKRRSSKEIEELVSAQSRSGLSVTAYCKERKIDQALFSRVKKRISNFPKISKFKKPRFVPVRPSPSFQLLSDSCSLSFPDGKILRFPASLIEESILSLFERSVP
jgi:hypothetical protein